MSLRKSLTTKFLSGFLLIVLGFFVYAPPALANLDNRCHNPAMYEAQLNVSPSSGPLSQNITLNARFRWTNAALDVCTTAEILFTVNSSILGNLANEVSVGKGGKGQWLNRNFTVTPSAIVGDTGSLQITGINFTLLVEENGFFANENIVSTQGSYTVSSTVGDGGDGTGIGTGTVPASGATVSFDFSLDNPLQATNLIELIDVIAGWLFAIAIPIAVAMIVYAGVMFLISRGDTTKVAQAKKILLYAVVGLAIILIGRGFITLIESILNIGTGPTP